MIKMKWIVTVLLIMTAPSCNDYVGSEYPSGTGGRGPRNPGRIQLSYSKVDSIEAGEFAVWYSGQNRPSDSLISELLYSLNFLRDRFDKSIRDQDSLPVLRAEPFLPPWEVSAVLIGVDDSAARKINRREYDAWNRFPVYLRPASYDSVRYGTVLLRFDGLLHPRRLAELYKTLPGVTYAEPDGFGFATIATFPILPRFDGVDWSYVFTRGRTIGPIWYFKYRHGTPHYVGVWNRRDPVPPWWGEASLNMDEARFVSWDGPPH